MERMTLREAAHRTARSITTLRRYIRNGRLHAEKRFGRFGPEYCLSPDALIEAGLGVDRSYSGSLPQTVAVSKSLETPRASPAGAVPISLYQELQMKHEQLLVQYGMIRAAGIRSMELRNRLERAEEQLEKIRGSHSREERAQRLHGEQMSKQLREAQLELEGRALEIVALKEKVRGLEMLTRNAITNETIEKQFVEIVDQSNRVERMQSSRDWRSERPRRTDSSDDA
jgi:hypothetical protein